MDLRETLHEIHLMAAYRKVRQGIRHTAAYSLVYGIINVAIGWDSLRHAGDHWLYAVPFAVGVVFLIEAAWMCLSPRTHLLLVDGLIMLAIGVYDVFLFALVFVLIGKPLVYAGLMAILLISSAVARFREFRACRQIFGAGFSEGSLRRLEKMTDALRRADVAATPDVLLLFLNGQEWRAQLGEDAVIFVGPQQLVMGYAKEDVTFKLSEPRAAGQTLRAEVELDQQAFDALIPAESYEKYAAWKAGRLQPDVGA